MKVNFNIENERVAICTLKVGDSFLAQRKSIKELGLYMIIDQHSSGLIAANPYKIITVNLISGQLRRFNNDDIIEPVKAEVNLKK